MSKYPHAFLGIEESTRIKGKFNLCFDELSNRISLVNNIHRLILQLKKEPSAEIRVLELSNDNGQKNL